MLRDVTRNIATSPSPDVSSNAMTSAQIDHIYLKQRLILKRKRLLKHYEAPLVMSIISLVFLAIPFKFYLLDQEPFEQEAAMFLGFPILTLALFLNQYFILKIKKVDTLFSKNKNRLRILTTLESLNWYVSINNNEFIEAFNPKRDIRTWGDEMILNGRELKLIVWIFFLSPLIFVSQRGFAQNKPVGVNTTTPLASLDVRGGLRMGGLNSFISFDSITGRVGWNNSRLFVPANQALIRHSSNNEGLYYNNLALEYRDQNSNPVFFTNWSNGNGFLSGPVGVGTNNPLGKLHILSDGTGFTSTVNSNIILENDGDNFLEFLTPGNYQSAILFQKPAHLQSGGIYYNSPGLPNGLLFRTNDAARMFIDDNGWVGIGGLPKSKLYLLEGSSGYSGGYFPGITIEGAAGRWVDLVTPFGTENGILFGNPSNIASGGIVYNNVATQNGLQFRTNGNITRMVLTKSQFLGIGITDPAFILDVYGRMRLRSDGLNLFTAGLWLNNLGNTETAFIGMEDDTHIGFHGISAGWKFTMNTSSGALRVNGSEGLVGQTIVSNGSGTPNWRAPSNSIYNSTTVKTQTGDIQLTINSPPTALPNLDHTFTVPGNAKVLVSMDLHLQSMGAAIGYPMIFVDIELDNNFITRFYENLDELGIRRNFKAGWLVSVTPGTHTIRLVVHLTDNVFVLGNNSFPSSVVYKVLQE